MQQGIFLKSFWVIQVQSQVWKLLSKGPHVWVPSHGSLGWYRNSTMAADCIPNPVNCLVTLDGWVTVGTKWGYGWLIRGLCLWGKDYPSICPTDLGGQMVLLWRLRFGLWLYYSSAMGSWAPTFWIGWCEDQWDSVLLASAHFPLQVQMINMIALQTI